VDRALDPERLRQAIGNLQNLPSIEELAIALAGAEIELLAGRRPQVDSLLETGWFLFGVASSHAALEQYGLPRVRAAFRVAAHIFDLVLQRSKLDDQSRLELCFAAQFAALRSEINPNAIAIYKREFPDGPGFRGLTNRVNELALALGAGLLATDLRYVFDATTRLLTELETLSRTWGIPRFRETIFGAASETALACRDIGVFLVRGDTTRLDRGEQRLRQAVRGEAARGDTASRWVAAQLLDFLDGLREASIWTALPPDVPASVRRAFVLTQPPIVQLWPPQAKLFGTQGDGDFNPFSPDARRQLISTPTSGGKTLVAQMLIANHLITAGTNVCYVAPTRSLCHEVRGSLDRRIRHIGASSYADLPGGAPADFTEFFDAAGTPVVEVMTPERLGHILRTNPQDVLLRFGMFVIDEAHNVADPARGWVLESAISYIHEATSRTYHKLLLISAAIGNRHHFVQWLRGDEEREQILEFHSDWRGPRRLHCLWTTQAEFDRSVEEPAHGARRRRRRIPVRGVLSIRPTSTGDVHHLLTNEDVGELILRRNLLRQWARDERSTPFYKMIMPLVRLLLFQGPVLVIEVTRPNTVRFAQVLAQQLPVQNDPLLQPIIDVVTTRLGEAHPLVITLRHGVAFHHGSLPLEVRTVIEEAVTSGLIRCVVATTTLTEGVNLPVRSVVIAAQGIRTGDEFNEFITGPRLLNAVGRAGRAGKETEGVVVLARQAQFNDADFDRLRPDDETLFARSSLATESALEELAALEALLAVREDAILEAAGTFVPTFLSFVWFVASALEDAGQAVTENAIHRVLRSTLGWTQIEDQVKQRWQAIADAATARYSATDEVSRKRWAKAGATLRSASRIEDLVTEIDGALANDQIIAEPAEAIVFLLGEGRVDRLLELDEAPKAIGVYNRRAGANRTALEISIAELVRDWIQGSELTTLAEAHLSDVPDLEFRFEQLADLLNGYCETFLPWVLNTVVQWINQRRTAAAQQPPLPKELGSYVRYGVNNPTALQLAVKGVRSRRLCIAVAGQWSEANAAGVQLGVRPWLARMSLAEWQQRFQTSTSELRSLLEFCRERRSGIAEILLTGGAAAISLETNLETLARAPASIIVEHGQDVHDVQVLSGDRLIGHITARSWPDVQVLVTSGIPFVAEVEVAQSVATLFLRLQEIPEADQ
jgi:hypothetical protein